MSAAGMSDVSKIRRIRGEMFFVLKDTHDGLRTRHSNSTLWSTMVRGLAFDASRNEITTTIQDLCRRGYFACITNKDEVNGKVYLTEIELLPKGRDLLEEALLTRHSSDSAIVFGPL